MNRLLLFTPCFLAAMMTGCGNPSLEESDVDPETPWSGIYTSTAEIRGFSGTAIALGPLVNGHRSYREHFYSCMGPRDGELPPKIETNENELTITKRWEYTDLNLAHLPSYENETKYTRLKLNDRIVLMRGDALKQFQDGNKLYDYGILLLVSEDPDSIEDLTTAPHPSIRILYEDSDADWNDPFVHGANDRK